MKATLLISIALLVVSSTTQFCDLGATTRTECGHFGINQQQCQSQGCCWQPRNIQDEIVTGNHRCFQGNGAVTCKNINFNWAGGPGFDQIFYDKMYALFDANIDIQGKGGVVASPDKSTPGGSYYYHWIRDAGLSMRTYMQINKFQLSVIEKKMKSYVNWVINVQGEIDPYGNDIRINPKYQLPNGQVFVGKWCRPQTDGPALRSAALILFADLLLKEGQTEYVTGTLLKLIKFDLEWIFDKWTSEGCDLWEEVRSDDFFWNRLAYIYALNACNSLFNKLGDGAFASKCAAVKSTIQITLDGHWTGGFMKESANREKDAIVIHAFSSFGVYPITDEKVTKTIQMLSVIFCDQYVINQQDNKANIPGVLIGRYPGDIYGGGNPWQLLTAVFAKAFYQGANFLMETKGFLKKEDKEAWFELLKIPQSASLQEQVLAAIQAGDAVLYRLYRHVKNDGGHIDEQINRKSGVQFAAKDLTWSLANILGAIREREKAHASFQTFGKTLRDM